MINPPVDLSIYDLTGTTASVIWGASTIDDPAIGYEYSIDNGAPVSLGTNVSVTFDSLTPNTIYNFRVRSIGTDSVSDWASIDISTTAGAPTAPMNVAASSITNVSAQVSWQAGSGGPAVIRYEYSLNNLPVVDAGLNLTAALSGMSSSTAQSFKVRAVGDFGVSGWSDLLFLTKGPPPAPISLIATSVSANSAEFQWGEIVTNNPATSYRYRLNDETPLPAGNAPSLLLQNLTVETSYILAVRAVNAYGFSNWTSIDFTTSIGAPKPPTNLAITSSSPTSFTATWSSPISGSMATSYLYSLDNAAWVGLSDGLVSITLDGLEPGSVHDLRVRSKNSAAESSTWATLAFTLPQGEPNAPLGLMAYQITENTAVVKWDSSLSGPEVLSYEYSLDLSEVLDAGPVTQIMFDGLNSDSTHTLRIRAVGVYGPSAWASVTFKTGEPEAPEIEVLRLKWDSVGKRIYENGLDRGVLYLSDKSGVPWNGLTGLDEDLGDESTEPLYFDGEKYVDAMTMGDYSGSLRAIVYPDEFMDYEGFAQIGNGIYADDQRVNIFGLSYRTLIGNDVVGDDHGYKIHIVYNLTAMPEQKSHLSLSPGLSLNEFAWTIRAVPEDVPGHRPTAHVIVDTRYMNEYVVRGIEDILYGSAEGSARLPSIAELVGFVEDYKFIRVTNNGDGTWTARGPEELIKLIDPTTFVIRSSAVVYVDEDTYTIETG